MPEQENSNLLRGKLYVVLCPLDSIRGKDNQFLSVEELKETPVYNLVNLTGFNLPLILSQDYEILVTLKKKRINQFYLKLKSQGKCERKKPEIKPKT